MNEIVEKPQIDFAYEIHKMMVDKKITLIYEGEVNQSIVKAFTAMTERRIDADESESTKKKVFHVTVECLQNICKHADNPVTGEAIVPGEGIFIIAYDDDNYIVVTGNPVANDKLPDTTEFLEQINVMEADELKALYKTKIRENRLSEKAGAGLGLLDIVRKTKNPLDFQIKKINDKVSFLLMMAKIERVK
ncbi:MAG: SiaB family protein kinase [Flavobacteriales bacterium]|nr:SiaB family protein kinase [Flavobacteriales bacterium]